MKNLVKPFGKFVGETSRKLNEELDSENPDRDELSAMGFDSRVELDGTDEVAEAIDEHFNVSELVQKWTEFKETLDKLTDQFSEKYTYDSSELWDAADALSESGTEYGYLMDVAVAQAIQKRL